LREALDSIPSIWEGGEQSSIDVPGRVLPHLGIFPFDRFLTLSVLALPISLLHSRAPMAQACNPSYSGDQDQEDNGSKPARQMVSKTLSQKKPLQKRAGGVAKGVGPEFKPQYCKKKKKRKEKERRSLFHTLKLCPSAGHLFLPIGPGAP
jgi:hypothetical protein